MSPPTVGTQPRAWRRAIEQSNNGLCPAGRRSSAGPCSHIGFSADTACLIDRRDLQSFLSVGFPVAIAPETVSVEITSA